MQSTPTLRRYANRLLFFIIILGSSGIGYWIFLNHDPTYLYQTFMGTPPPADIANVRGSGRLAVPILDSSTGHLTYQAQPTYIAWLLKHTSGLSGDGFHIIACTDIPQRFADIVRRLVNQSTPKTCITGMYVIYAHLLIYDSATTQVDHFIIGLQE